MRSVSDLEEHAVHFWPAILAEREQTTSIIPRLIETQEKFIGILYVADGSPTAWTDVLTATAELPGNLFLKHLIVLADVGGERLQRFRANLSSIFPGETMFYTWRGTEYTYQFQSIGTLRGWGNKQLLVDGRGLLTPQPLNAAIEDAAMLLMHAGASVDQGVPDEILERCVIGAMLGEKTNLDSFVRQRYIQVSRVTRGATANTMGQLCQAYVREHLQAALPAWNFSRSSIPGISQNAGRTDISFDIVAESPDGHYCAIEVSFQVTTNSVIERKSGQAESRRQLLRRHGHKMAYVIDGAVNFERRSAISTICENSDCTVAFRDEELDKLADFLRTTN